MVPRSLIARVSLAAAVVATVGVIAGPAFGARSHATGAAVTVTAAPVAGLRAPNAGPAMTPTVAKTSVPHGSVTFTLVNKGKLGHDFKIGGKKTAVIAPGKTAKLTVTLKAGKAAYLCTVPGHAAAGMKGTLNVK